MHPVTAPLPKLHAARLEPKAAPMIGERDRPTLGIPLLSLLPPLIQDVSTADDGGLCTRPGSDPGTVRPGVPVRLRLRSLNRDDLAKHHDLTLEVVPGEDQAGPRVRLELASLARVQVGEEREAASIGALE